MFLPTKIYFLVFGLLTIAGGVMGYVKAGSTASLIAGGISGVLLIVAASHVAIGLALGIIVSLLLAGRFLPTFFKTGKMMPNGMMALLSIVAIVFAILAWLRK